MKKKIVIGLIALLFVLTAGCIMENAPTPNIPKMQLNDFENGKISFGNSIPDDGIYLTTTYTTDYNVSEWRITDSKNILIECKAICRNGTIILLEHMHADISLKSKYAEFDGLPQDSMDDNIHGGLQPGFSLINHSYECYFAIEGFSKTLIDGWGWVIGGFGGMDIDENRLTENNLVNTGGVYGNKIQIVYDFVVKNPGEEYFHTHSIIDEFMVVK